MGNVDGAMAKMRESMAILENLDRLHVTPLKQVEFDRFGPYGSIGQLYLFMKRPDSALWYIQKAYHICSEGKDRRRLPLSAAVLGNAYEATVILRMRRITTGSALKRAGNSMPFIFKQDFITILRAS
jgi:hypothetical protein